MQEAPKPTSKRISFVDLKAQYAEIGTEIMAAIEGVMASSTYVLGPAVERFEKRFADYCQTEHCVGVSSGTAALHLALLALDIGPGDEIITTPHTFVATAWAISYVGAKPVFVDIDPNTFTIDPKQIEEKITARTRAIIPVHIYGQPADMRPIVDVAERHGIAVIEDAAQAHGAEYEGRRSGSLGTIGCFSFYPGKNLGAYGEAGAVVTDDRSIAERVKQLRNHAQPTRYVHSELGYNYRMDAIQGAILDVKLSYLDDWNSDRRRTAVQYDHLLGEVDVLRLPAEAQYSRHVYHIYAILLESEEARDSLQQWLSDANIQTGKHYPIPVHLQQAYRWLEHFQGDFPVTESTAKRELSLPMYAELTDEEVRYVADSILDWAGQGGIPGALPTSNTVKP